MFRPITVRYRLPNGKRVKKGTPDARKDRSSDITMNDTESIPDDWYGSATDGIRRILARAAAIACFERRPTVAAWESAVALVHSHLTALGRAMPREPVVRNVEVSLLVGDWSCLRQAHWMEDAYVPWGDRWAESVRLLSVCTSTQGQAVQSSEHARTLTISVRRVFRASYSNCSQGTHRRSRSWAACQRASPCRPSTLITLSRARSWASPGSCSHSSMPHPGSIAAAAA